VDVESWQRKKYWQWARVIYREEDAPLSCE
jgi:hypothetical protein